MNISERIKIIRERFCEGSNLRFAEVMDEKPQTTSGWVSGNRGIGKNVIDKILSKFPEVSSNWLLSGEGEMLKSKTESNARIIPNPNIIMVPLIGKYAYAGYLAGYGDEEYVDTMPKMPFIIHDGPAPRGEYVSIEVSGDSMDNGSPEAILDGDVLLCRQINRNLWSSSKLHYKKWNFVIMTNEGILVKRIIDHDVEKGIIKIHSLNEMFPDKEINLREVIQIFNVVKIMRDPVL